MVWSIPTARQIADRLASALEAGLLAAAAAKATVIDPIKLSLAVRSSRGVFAQITRATALELREVHDHVAWGARQVFPDICDDDIVPEHGSIWGVERRAAISATGSVLVTGTPATALAAGVQLSSANGVSFVTTSAAIIGPSGVISIPASCTTGGDAGNLATGVQLSDISGIPAITSVVVDSAFVGGVDQQSIEDWRHEILNRIRRPPHGGAAFDYPAWVAEVSNPAAVAVISPWVGNGSIALVIALKDGSGVRAPSPAELVSIGSHIDTVRPVTARTIPVAATIRTLTASVRVRPNTVAVQASVTAAWQRFVASIGDEDDTSNQSPIGAVIEISRLSEALSAANGEYAHDLIAPAATFTLGQLEYPVAGALTFV